MSAQYDWLRAPRPEPKPSKLKLARIKPYPRPQDRPQTAYDEVRKSKPIVVYNNINGSKRTVNSNRRVHAYDAVEHGVYDARSYSPLLEVIARQPKPGQITLGIELELINARDANDYFRIVCGITKKYLDKKAILVTDGSLHGQGIEINSVPMTENEYRQSRHLWHLYIKSLAAQGYKTTDSCGLHMHVNGNYMPEEHWQWLQWWITANANVFSRLSGRHPRIGRGFEFCQFQNDHRKYRALNLSHDCNGLPLPTREFRFFSGTAKPATFFNCVETYILLAKFGAANGENLGNQNVRAFLDFCNNQALYPTTAKWITSECERIQRNDEYRLENQPRQQPQAEPIRKPYWYNLTLEQKRAFLTWNRKPAGLNRTAGQEQYIAQHVYGALFNTNYGIVNTDIPCVSRNLEIRFEGFWRKEMLASSPTSILVRMASNNQEVVHGVILRRYQGGWGRRSPIHAHIY